MFESTDPCVVLCLFGFDPAQDRDDPSYVNKTVIFFTDNVLAGALGYTVYYDGVNCDLEAFANLCQEMPFDHFIYSLSPYLTQEKRQMAEVWVQRCKEVQWHRFLSASEKKDFGIQSYQNIREGLEHQIDTSAFSSMKGMYEGIPALICGGGPSLALEVDLLKTHSDKGLLFAGGAALGYLTSQGVEVHIAAGVDPDPDQERVRMRGSLDAPFFFQSRFSAACLKDVRGPRFCVPSNPGSDLEEWLEGQEPFDGGWTVTTFCYALAEYFGCSPIVLVGVDLSYPPSKTMYAQGKKEEHVEPLIWEEEKGILYTKKDWIIAARWLENRIQKNRVYATSLTGLSLKGTIKKPLNLLFQQELLYGYPVKDLIDKTRVLWQEDRVRLEKVVLLEKSIEVCLHLVEKLLAFFQEAYPKDPSDRGLFVLCLMDLEEQIFYKKRLVPLWELWRGPITKGAVDPYAKQVHELLFFKKVIEEYRSCICKVSMI